MASNNTLTQILCPLLLLHITWFLLIVCAKASNNDRKSYIVYMGPKPEISSEASISSVHMSFLQKAVGSNFHPELLVHSYKKSFNGFVAKLSDDEAQKLAEMPEIVSVFLNEKNQLHTTRSWDFMGFSQEVNRTYVESDIIVGVIDGGIWPESESFSDKGYGPPPTKWKGSCQISSNFTCNKKIIGAKYYRSDRHFPADDIQSPRDNDGHGTHTASTVAGGLVNMASLYGLGEGTARGGVPSARIAVYKVCWSDGCYDADILAAFDDAIADGVDLISISVGSYKPRNYFINSIAIGSFHAMRHGILTSCSAGNDGPATLTIVNFAPWSLSVAASTIDRKFLTKVLLGSNKTCEGISINTFELGPVMYPLIYGGDAPNVTGNINGSVSRFCTNGTLNPGLVKGKIVLCDAVTDGLGPYMAGAIGAVMRSQRVQDTAFSFPLPVSNIDMQEGNDIFSYLNSTRGASAIIYSSSEGKDELAPYVASFSSRGPNAFTFDILKPDIAAPGVDILASWSPLGSVSGKASGDRRSVQYNIISGTSMACPHATGAAAYVKSYHPNWSPAAIRSALMTTAIPMNSTQNPEHEFAYGSGHLNPVKAVNPGLVYDASPIDYVKFLCGQGYTATQLKTITGENITCSESMNITVWDLNYPSFAVSTPPLVVNPRVFNRVVTNVGSPSSAYRALVLGVSGGLDIVVTPSELTFTQVGQSLPFSVTVQGTIRESIASASLIWDDGVHQVRSPITVFIVNP